MQEVTPSQIGDTSRTTRTPAITALLQRACTGLLFNSLRPPTEHNNFEFWQGYARALNDMGRGAGEALAAKDGASGGYQTPAMLQAAASVLGNDVYTLSRAEVEDRLRSAGIELPANPVADDDVTPAQQLENAAVASINPHDEHAVLGIVGHDGAVLHGASVGQGGAA